MIKKAPKPIISLTLAAASIISNTVAIPFSALPALASQLQSDIAIERDVRPSFQNPQLQNYCKTDWTRPEVLELLSELATHGTLKMRRYSSGGHSAVTVNDDQSLENAIDGLLILHWDRDNIMQAIAEYRASQNPELSKLLGYTSAASNDAALRGLQASVKHHVKHFNRFTKIIEDPSQASNFMLRPHIRYNPISLSEISDPWGHAQNDALAFIAFMIFYMDSASDADQQKLAAIIPHYFKAIQVWQDYDLGAWEDKKAQHSSSIMLAAIAMQQELEYVKKHGPIATTVDGKTWTADQQILQEIVDKCMAALQRILPDEYRIADDTDTRADRSKIRKFDAAHVNALFLNSLSSHRLFDDEMARSLMGNIEKNLMGPIGVARYKTDIWDGRVDRKDLKEHEEAQWSHVSPMMSFVYGEMYLRGRNDNDRVKQSEHFCRSISHINERWKIPEAYIIDPVTRKWISDANEPLAWAQAATTLAFDGMLRTLDQLASSSSSSSSSSIGTK